MRSIFKALLVLSLPYSCTPIYSRTSPETPQDFISDQRISSAARGCAEELLKRKAQSLDKETVDFFLEQAGVHDVLTFSSFMASSSSSPVEEIMDRRSMREYRDRGFTHMGTGSVTKGGKKATCFFLVKRELDLDHLPLQVPPGQRVTLTGGLRGRARPSEVILLSPSGTLTRFTAVVQGQRFTAHLQLPREEGRMTIEVIVEDEWGPRPAILAHLYAGIPPPSAPRSKGAQPSAKPPESSFPGSPRQAEEEMIRLINRDRKLHGFPPLQEMPDLSQVAREHSRTMKERRRLSHVIPGIGGPEDRVKAAHIPHASILENVALARTVESAEGSLMESPGHRMNILDPAATHVGVGAVFADGLEGQELYITQDFIVSVERKAPSVAAQEILGCINIERKAKGLEGLVEDGALSAIARDHSGVMIKEGRLSPSGVLDRVKKRGIQYRQIQVQVLQTMKLNDVRGAGTREKKAKAIGIGVAQAEEGAFWITLIFLEPQGRDL